MTRLSPSLPSLTLPLVSRSRALALGAALLALSSSACLRSAPDSSPEGPEALEKSAPVVESPPLPPGSYPIQSMAYDDADGAYRVFLLDAPPSHRGAFVSTELRMARLTDEEIAAGKGAIVEVDAEGPVAKLPPDFAIQYVHNVTEEVPSGGRNETVVVRQETSSWSPFMAGMAGMAIGSMLFSPMYHYPPPYARGSMLTGSGGYGATRMAAQQSFSSKHGSLPQSAKLSQSGYAKRPSSALKPTGSGAGSTRMNKPAAPSKPRGGFGGGFGGGGRRRR